MKFMQVLGVAVVALMTASGAARATTIQYATQPDFAAASGPLTMIDFEGLAPSGGLFNTSDPGGLTIGGVNFRAAPGTYIAVVDTGYYAPYYDRGTGDVIHAQGGSQMIVTFGSAVSSVGALFGTIFRSDVTLSVGLSNGDSFAVDLAGGADWRFSGFVSDAANILSLTISNVGGDYILLDRLQFSTTAATGVPAPGALVLLGFGLLGVGVVQRRRRSVAEGR